MEGFVTQINGRFLLALLLGLGVQKKLAMSVEPGLFEWLIWHKTRFPQWLTLEELQGEGFNINQAYQPIIPADQLTDCSETIEQFYDRSALLTHTVLKNTLASGQKYFFNILIKHILWI